MLNHLELRILLAAPMLLMIILILVLVELARELMLVEDKAVGFFGPSHDCVLYDVRVEFQDSRSLKLDLELGYEVI